MAFKKREKSATVDAAQTRLAAMKAIDQAQGAVVNYGTAKLPCTSTTVGAQSVKIEADIEKYNGLLAQADELGNSISQAEKVLNDDLSRVLMGARAQFGLDSNEVEQLGGTRKSERAKRTVKPAPAPAKEAFRRQVRPVAASRPSAAIFPHEPRSSAAPPLRRLGRERQRRSDLPAQGCDEVATLGRRVDAGQP